MVWPIHVISWHQQRFLRIVMLKITKLFRNFKAAFLKPSKIIRLSMLSPGMEIIVHTNTIWQNSWSSTRLALITVWVDAWLLLMMTLKRDFIANISRLTGSEHFYGFNLPIISLWNRHCRFRNISSSLVGSGEHVSSTLLSSQLYERVHGTNSWKVWSEGGWVSSGWCNTSFHDDSTRAWLQMFWTSVFS